MIRVKDLSPEFQEIYVKYKKVKQDKPEIKSTFEKASEFILEKNKKLIGMLNAEETILMNQPKIDQKKKDAGFHSIVSQQIEKKVKQNKGARLKKLIQGMISIENLKVPEEYKVNSNSSKANQIVDILNLNGSEIHKKKSSNLIRLTKNTVKADPCSSSPKVIASIQSKFATPALEIVNPKFKKYRGSVGSTIPDEISEKKTNDAQSDKELEIKRREMKQKQKQILKLKIHLDNDPPKRRSNAYQTEKILMDSIDKDLVYFSKIESNYKKGRLLDLQNSKDFSHCHNLPSIDKSDRDFNTIAYTSPTDRVGLNLKAANAISNRKFSANEAIEDFFLVSKKLKKDFIDSLEMMDRSKNELSYKLNFFKSNYC